MSIKIASMNFGECDTILHNTPNGVKNIAEVLGPNGEVYWSSIKELIGIPPFSIRSNGTMLLDYLISGNMTQTGTPTPTTPIQPQGTGERTGNLFDKNSDTINNNGQVRPGVKVSSGTYSINNTTDRAVYYRIGNEGTTTQVNGGRKAENIIASDDLYVWRDSNVRQDGVMLNPGSTALPYEPYGYKIPISSGGVNLFDKTANYNVGGTTYNYTISGLDPDKYYTCSTNFERISGVYTASLYFNGGNSLENGVWSDTPRTVKPNSNGEIIVYIRYKTDAGAPVISGDVMAGTIWVMVNEGSEALPYEPYNRITTPIYLGEVETTRKIRKLVLDGTENVSYNARNDTFGRWVVTIPTANGTTTPENVICTHFKTVNATTKPLTEGGICMRSTGVDVVVGGLYTDIDITAPSDSTTIVNAVKAYLAAQYAAGTPVTVWYVLATPETAVVNEPLRKIGDYADTVSYEQAEVQIPTNRGNTVIDVETTLKPSQMYIKYK